MYSFMSLFWAAAPFVVVGVLILLVLAWLTGGLAKYPYRRLDTLFTPTETNFYYVLVKAVGNDYRIFGKVRVADVLTPRRRPTKSGWWSAFTKISSKHVDYILVNNAMAPVCAIELDDSSHARKDRIKRDKFLDGVFKAAELPLIRVPARRQYAINELRNRIHEAVGNTHQPVNKNVTPGTCPKCGYRLEKKMANAGSSFLGCSNFPNCRYIQNNA